MPDIRRILVAVKDPAKSSSAVAKAARLAHAFDARLELYHAITEPLLADAYIYPGDGLRRFQRETQKRYLSQLEALAEPLRKEGLEVSTSTGWDFPAHEAIVRQARRVKADLIVAEVHAGRRLMPWLLHLTDWELLRTSAVPVLIVKSAQPWKKPKVLAALDPSHAFAKPAKLDAIILDAAAKLSEALGGSLHAMHAYTPIPIGAAPTGGASALALGEIASATAARARAGFERSLGSVRIPKARQHLVQGQPFEAIPRVAKEVGSAILVMGAISRSGLKRVVIGNTAERVLNALTCDVLVVKPERFKARVAWKGRGARYVGLPQIGAPM